MNGLQAVDICTQLVVLGCEQLIEGIEAPQFRQHMQSQYCSVAPSLSSTHTVIIQNSIHIFHHRRQLKPKDKQDQYLDVETENTLLG